MFQRVNPYSSGILSATLIAATPEVIRAHWLTAVFTMALGLILVILARQIQQSWYFRHHPAELAAWQAAPPPPRGFRGGRRLQLWRWATWPPQDEQRRERDSNSRTPLPGSSD